MQKFPNTWGTVQVKQMPNCSVLFYRYAAAGEGPFRRLGNAGRCYQTGDNMLRALFQSVSICASTGGAGAARWLDLLILFGHPSGLSKVLYPLFWNNMPIGE